METKEKEEKKIENDYKTGTLNFLQYFFFLYKSHTEQRICFILKLIHKIQLLQNGKCYRQLETLYFKYSLILNYICMWKCTVHII